jgi:hypothetical protein
MAGGENSGPAPANNAANATQGDAFAGSGSTNKPTTYSMGSSSSNKSKSKSYSFTPRESANSQLDQQMQKLFGRRATTKEKAAYFKALNAAEKKYASVTKGKSSERGGTSSTTDADGNTSGGSSSSGQSSSVSTSYSFDQASFLYEYSVSLATKYIQQGKTLGGDAAIAFNNIKTYASDMGIVLGDKSAVAETLNIILGKKDESIVKGDYRKRAIAMYGGLASRLNENPALTVREAAADYIETMSTMLDIGTKNITLFDNTLSKALTATKDGKPYTKTLNEFRADLRADNRFQYSTMAQQEAKNLGSSFAKALGFGAVSG